jgi:hypothetical protein
LQSVEGATLVIPIPTIYQHKLYRPEIQESTGVIIIIKEAATATAETSNETVSTTT